MAETGNGEHYGGMGGPPMAIIPNFVGDSSQAKTVINGAVI